MSLCSREKINRISRFSRLMLGEGSAVGLLCSLGKFFQDKTEFFSQIQLSEISQKELL